MGRVGADGATMMDEYSDPVVVFLIPVVSVRKAVYFSATLKISRVRRAFRFPV